MRAPNFRGNVGVTGNVDVSEKVIVGEEIVINDVAILERITQMQAQIDILQGKLLRLESAD